MNKFQLLAKNLMSDVTPAEAVDLIKNTPGLKILDVRTPEEFAEGSIPGALNLDFYNDPQFNDKIAALPKDVPYLIYCKKNKRGHYTKSLMVELGFPEVYSMVGGYQSWKAQGFDKIKFAAKVRSPWMPKTLQLDFGNGLPKVDLTQLKPKEPYDLNITEGNPESTRMADAWGLMIQIIKDNRDILLREAQENGTYLVLDPDKMTIWDQLISVKRVLNLLDEDYVPDSHERLRKVVRDSKNFLDGFPGFEVKKDIDKLEDYELATAVRKLISLVWRNI